MYNKNMKLNAKQIIKVLLSKENMKQKELAEKLSQYCDKTYSASALSHKIGRGTITYDEVASIADILGYNIEFIKK